jgi:hypothetical protein
VSPGGLRYERFRDFDRRKGSDDGERQEKVWKKWRSLIELFGARSNQKRQEIASNYGMVLNQTVKVASEILPGRSAETTPKPPG